MHLNLPDKRCASKFRLVVFAALLLACLPLSLKAQLSIACPPNAVQGNDLGLCSAVVLYTPPTGAGSGTGLSTQLTDGLPSGSAFPVGTTSVTYTVTNNEGDSESCSFTVDVADVEDPVIDCPADVVINAEPGVCGAVFNFVLPSATDNCAVVSLTQIAGPPSGALFPIGDTNLDFEALDAAGNSTLCRFVVTVLDVGPPTIVCPAPITVPADASCVALVNYTAPVGVDACSISNTTLTAGLGSGANFPLGTTTETYTVSDLNGNVAQCSFNITVVDLEPPVISCPPSFTLNIIQNLCDTLVVYPLPTATDNCSSPIVGLVSGITIGTEAAAGFYSNTYMATDAAGNTATCSFDITIVENIDPVIACPGDLTFPTAPGTCEAVVTFSTPSVTDVCTAVSIVQTSGPASGATLAPGSYAVEFTATDEFNNTSICIFQLIVVDDVPPVFTCPTGVLFTTAEPGLCGANVSYSPPVATDFCGAVSVVLTSGQGPGSFFDVGTHEEIYTATDLSGNESTCTINIEVTDDELPILTCPADIALTDIATCGQVVVYDAPLATDNCAAGVPVLTGGLQSGDFFPLGNTLVTWSVDDASGNENTCSFNVLLSESEAPVFTNCPADISISTEPGLCSAVLQYDPPEAIDNCGVVALIQTAGPASGTVLPPGTAIVTYTATDLSGNESTCSFEITVTDDEAPQLACSGSVTIDTAPGECGATYDFELPVASDNCTPSPLVVQTEGPPSGSTLAVGVTAFAFVTTDDAGNATLCAYDVLVVDNEAPVFSSCPGDILVEIAENTCEVSVDYLTPEAADNCSAVVSLLSGPVPGSTLTPGVYSVQWEAVDAQGNAALCSFTITVQDPFAPVIECPPDFLLCEEVGVFGEPTATDNCGIASITQTAGPASGSVFPLGESTITYLVTDINGNASTCSFVITRAQSAEAATAEEDKNICNLTFASISANAPSTGTGTWSVLSGSGEIADTTFAESDVSGLSDGENILLWSIDPQNGCPVASDSLTITVEIDAVLNVFTSQTILSGSAAALEADFTPTGGDLFWTPEASLSCSTCSNPIATPALTTTYIATYTTPLGCTLTDSLTITVILDLPNTITPNNDGVNDVWNIPQINQNPDVEVYIYNRWGNEVFQSKGYRDPWNGKRGGDDLPAGSYFFIIDYKQEGMENLNGTVNIIR